MSVQLRLGEAKDAEAHGISNQRNKPVPATLVVVGLPRDGCIRPELDLLAKSPLPAAPRLRGRAAASLIRPEAKNRCSHLRGSPVWPGHGDSGDPRDFSPGQAAWQSCRAHGVLDKSFGALSSISFSLECHCRRDSSGTARPFDGWPRLPRTSDVGMEVRAPAAQPRLYKTPIRPGGKGRRMVSLNKTTVYPSARTPPKRNGLLTTV